MGEGNAFSRLMMTAIRLKLFVTVVHQPRDVSDGGTETDRNTPCLTPHNVCYAARFAE